MSGRAPLQPLAVAVLDFERQHIERALLATGGRRSAAAKLLGISRKTLWKKMRRGEIS